MLNLLKFLNNERLSKIRFSSISIRFNNWDNRIDMKDTVIKLQAASEDLWSKIMDLEYDKEGIEKRKDIWRGYVSSESILAMDELDDDLKAVQESQDMLMHSYSVIMYKIANLCRRENVPSAMEKAV
jgi:hypothetical protein